MVQQIAFCFVLLCFVAIIALVVWILIRATRSKR